MYHHTDLTNIIPAIITVLVVIIINIKVQKYLQYILKLIYLFYFTILYWFCHTPTWIRHGCTCVPHPEPHSHLPPYTIPLGHPSAPALSTLYHAQTYIKCIKSNKCGDPFHIWYFTCFNAILPYHPTLTLSHRVQKTVQYICVSFAILHTELSLPSF